MSEPGATQRMVRHTKTRRGGGAGGGVKERWEKYGKRRDREKDKVGIKYRSKGKRRGKEEGKYLT